jgi:hypothetical protein
MLCPYTVSPGGGVPATDCHVVPLYCITCRRSASHRFPCCAQTVYGDVGFGGLEGQNLPAGIVSAGCCAQCECTTDDAAYQGKGTTVIPG